jgi:UDP-glucose 4-epimerase
VSADVTLLVGDVLDPQVLRRAAEGADVVFHLASIRKPDHADPDQMVRVNVDGTLAVASAARLAGVRRLVHFSSTAVYGDTSGVTVDEHSQPTPQGLYARTKLMAESIVREHAPGAVVLRLAAVYGPGQRGNYLRLARLCHRRVRLTGARRRTLVYEDDAMAAAIMAAEHADAPGQVFNVTDGSLHTLSAITAAMIAALDTRSFITVPAAVVRLMARWRAGPDVLRPLLEDSAVSGRRMQTRLNYTPSVDLQRGWRLAIEGWRAQGLL